MQVVSTRRPSDLCWNPLCARTRHSSTRVRRSFLTYPTQPGLLGKPRHTATETRSRPLREAIVRLVKCLKILDSWWKLSEDPVNLYYDLMRFLLVPEPPELKYGNIRPIKVLPTLDVYNQNRQVTLPVSFLGYEGFLFVGCPYWPWSILPQICQEEFVLQKSGGHS